MPQFQIPNSSKKPNSLNTIREKGKYFLTLSLMHNNKIYKLPNEPLISLSKQKIIVETPTLQNHNITETNAIRKIKGLKPIEPKKGTVKEFINSNDYNITIKGVCIDKENKGIPYDDIRNLNELANINEPLIVKGSKFLAFFNIYQIVIKDIHFDEMQGAKGLQSYIINAVSNEDFYADLITKTS